MKKLLAVLLTLCVLLTVCSGIFVYAESGDTRTGISDIYKWDFGYDSDTGTVTETNSGKHCMIQRHSGYFYHANNGCDCMDAAEVAHFNPFRLVAYSNGYNPTHSTDYIDKYVPMVQDGNCWTFIDAVDLGGLDWVSSSNVMEYFLCSSVDRGIVFTAPVSGVIEFDFYFKSISDSKADLLIGKKASMTETCDSWSGDWDRDSCIEYIEGSTADGLDSITITVEAGEEVVFLLHSNMTDGVRANFFFDSVEYTLIPTTTGVRVIGAQDKNDGEKYNTRFIATVDDYTQYEELGFKIVADYGNNNVRIYDRHCTEVFDSLLALEDGASVTKTALDFNGKYLFALTVNNIPMDVSGDATFSVQAYYIKDGQTVYTDAVTFTAADGELQ